jgi:Zn-dependent membrane protease YugP
MTPSVWLISLVFIGISMLVSGVLKGKFKRYNQIPLSAGLTGSEVALKMLHDNGIYDVKVVTTNSFLSDHYDPSSKTVNLSPDVYNGISVAAAAIAAHECGHAVQHATAYQWLTLRSRLVPVVQFSSGIVQWILLLGILTIRVFPTLLLFGIVLFGLTTLFSIITLPVEIDASRRALAWLNRTNITNAREYPNAKDALKWAAYTYVVAALASIAILVQYILIFLSGSRNRN